MLKHPQLTEARIQKALPRIEALIHPERLPVEVSAWHVGGEPVPFSRAVQAEYLPFSVGDAWGPAWDTSWFRVRGEIPASWKVEDAHVLFQLTDQGREGFTAEGLIYADGKPIRAVNRARKEIKLAPCLTQGRRFEFYVEGAANMAHPEGLLMVYKPGPLFVLAQAELSRIHRPAFDYYHDFKVAMEAMLALPEGQRRAELRYALNDSVNQWVEKDPSTIPAARACLKGVLSKKNGDTVHRVSAVGNAHIDTAWLWPLRETIRKCARTFSTTLEYMESYPEYIFACSQAQQLAWMKVFYPDIWKKIVAAAKRGQFELVGSMWIEADCNLASGESMIRQILYGKRFFQEEFGYETKDAWIPDVFGYSAAMPQIFKGCNLDYFITQKISWNQFNKFPHHTFLWEGLDGSRIFTHFAPADTYIGTVAPKELAFAVTNFQEHGRASRSIYLYGHGDGGGGPDISMLEQARRLQDFDGLPRVQQERVMDFLPKARADAKDPAVWVGELYLELHRGTYTTQAQTKKGNRKSEFLLRDAEFFDAASRALVPDREEKAADPQRAVYDVTGQGAKDNHLHARALERAWKLVLLNQFHDIIPGSSIAWVYEDSNRDYRTVAELGQSVVDSSLQAIAEKIDTFALKNPVRVANTLNWERREIVDFPDGSVREVTAPSCGHVVLDASAAAGKNDLRVSVAEKEGFIEMANSRIRLRLGQDGLIHSLRDLEAGREVIAPEARGNLFQIHPDLPLNFDAWDIDLYYKEQGSDLRGLDRMEIIESHPLRAKVRIERSFGKSRIVQEIVLSADSRRLDFVTEVDWQEEHRLLKVAFPVDILSPRATYEIQFGHLERPTHYNTSWDLARFEVCAHKWADLSEADYGVALLNDCKYGYDIYGNVMRLSLLRSPTAPDPKADRGRHRFTYSLLPHAGDFRAGRVIEESYQLNVPLLLSAMESQPGTLPAKASWFRVDRAGVILESVKVAEAGDGIVVRLYESHGSRGKAVLNTSLPVKSAEVTDMLENKQKNIPLENGSVELAMKPFEIVTLKFRLEK